MMHKDIILSWFFPHPAEKLWECLTQPELIGQWLMKNNFEPVVGHQFKMYARALPRMGWDGVVHCEVLAIEPLKRISFSWKGGSGNGNMILDTIVTWTLTPGANGTHLKLEHTGFKGFKNLISAIIMEQGWKKKVMRRFSEILDSSNTFSDGSVSGTR